MTGTVPRKGNSLRGGAEGARKTGNVSELVYPSITPEMTEQEFFAQPQQNIKDLGLKWLNDYSFQYEWVASGSAFNIAKAKEALKHSPLQTAIDASTKRTNEFNGWNDSVMIYGYEEGKFWKVFGSYPETTGNFDWDYPFFNGLKFNLNKYTPTNMKINLFRNSENGKIYLVDSDGVRHHIKDEPTFKEFFGLKAFEEKDWTEVENEAQLSHLREGEEITRGKGALVKAILDALRKFGNKLTGR